MGRTWLPPIPPPEPAPRPFTIDAVKWSYVHGRCTFEEMEKALELLMRREAGEDVTITTWIAFRTMRSSTLPTPRVGGIDPDDEGLEPITTATWP